MQYTTLNDTTVQYTTVHYTTLHYTKPHYVSNTAQFKPKTVQCHNSSKNIVPYTSLDHTTVTTPRVQCSDRCSGSSGVRMSKAAPPVLHFSIFQQWICIVTRGGICNEIQREIPRAKPKGFPESSGYISLYFLTQVTVRTFSITNPSQTLLGDQYWNV